MTSETACYLVDALGRMHAELASLESRIEQAKTELRQYAAEQQTGEIIGNEYKVSAQTYRRPVVNTIGVFGFMLSLEVRTLDDDSEYTVSGGSLKSLATMSTVSPTKLLAAVDATAAYDAGLVADQTKTFHTISVSRR